MEPSAKEKTTRVRDEHEGKEPRKSKELPGDPPGPRGACAEETTVQGSE